MPARRAPLDRNVVVLGGASLLHDVSSEMAFPFLPAFLTSVLGAPPLYLGLIEGAADSVSSLLRPLFGILSDRFGRRKPFVVLGYTLANAVRPLLAVVSAPWQVLGIRLCDRLGKAVRTAPRDALLADSVESDGRGRAFGFHRSMDHAGAVAGPLLASVVFVAVERSYPALFLAASVPGIAAVLLAALRVREPVAAPRELSPPRAPAPSRPEGADPARRLSPRFWGLMGAIFLFTLGNSSDAFLLLRLEQAGVDVAWLPALWAGLHVVKTATVYPCGALSDRVGRRPMLLAGWAYYALVYVGFAVVTSPAGVVAVFLAYGLFHGLTEGTERALVGDLVAPELRGTAFGVYNAILGIGALPASVVMGAVWQSAGAGAAFLLGAGLAVAGALALAAVPLPERQ